MFQEKYPEASIITTQDVGNFKTPRRVGWNNANQLLQKF